MPSDMQYNTCYGASVNANLAGYPLIARASLGKSILKMRLWKLRTSTYFLVLMQYYAEIAEMSGLRTGIENRPEHIYLYATMPRTGTACSDAHNFGLNSAAVTATL